MTLILARLPDLPKQGPVFIPRHAGYFHSPSELPVLRPRIGPESIIRHGRSWTLEIDLEAQ